MSFTSNCPDGLCGAPDCGICGPLMHGGNVDNYDYDQMLFDEIEDEEDEEFPDEDEENLNTNEYSGSNPANDAIG